MIRRFLCTFTALAAFAAGPLSLQATETGPTDDPTIVVVKMLDKSATEFVFEPSNITVKPGDVIRFVQTTATPHNVEFKNSPAGADLASILMGPFLMAPDETYEIVVDQRFVEGTYEFVCTPHFMMGMTGTITVAAAEQP
jgi:plastocyanin